MRQALAHVHDAEITVAVRDSLVRDLQVKKDDVIGLVDGQLVAQGASLEEVLGKVLAELAAHTGMTTLAAVIPGRSSSRDFASSRSGTPGPAAAASGLSGG